jgi:transcriptional regulator
MYQPSHFKEERPEAIRSLIADHPLGALVTFAQGGIEGNHMPFLYDPDPAPLGTLRCHVARANPVWREFKPEVEALVMFQGPQLYVSPAWYPAKKEHGKVVPTWNYLVVHAYGPVRVMDDTEWLRRFVTRLTDRFEAERTDPWKVTDAPPEFVDSHLKAIVGIEIPVTRIAGKWKASQNRPGADRENVARELRARGDAGAEKMAEWVENQGTKHT